MGSRIAVKKGSIRLRALKSIRRFQAADHLNRKASVSEDKKTHKEKKKGGSIEGGHRPLEGRYRALFRAPHGSALEKSTSTSRRDSTHSKRTVNWFREANSARREIRGTEGNGKRKKLIKTIVNDSTGEFFHEREREGLAA